MIFIMVVQGETEVFDKLYSNCKNLMIKKAYGILHDYMLAEDAVNEAFIRIYKNIHKIDDPSSNRSVAFVMMIVKNTSLTMLSKEKKGSAEQIDEAFEDSFDLEGHVLSEMSSERIYELLNGVNEDLRSVFLMKYAYDLPHKKIGQLLKITENNVTVRLHRAKKQIAAMLREEGITVEK